MALFESYERRVDKINAVLAEYGINSIEECRAICKEKGFDPYEIVKGVQPIAFENAGWAYCVGAAIAIRRKAWRPPPKLPRPSASACRASASPAPSPTTARSASATAISARCCSTDDTKCFAFLAGHESFAAAEGAIGIVRNANKARKEPLRVILNGLGKDAAQIISRINGFTYVQTQFDYYTGKLTIVREIPYSRASARRRPLLRRGRRPRGRGHHAPRGAWTCPSPATPPTPPASSTLSPAPYKKVHRAGQEVLLRRLRRRHGPYPAPDNMAAGPASYGMTDTMGRRCTSDAQFAGSDEYAPF